MSDNCLILIFLLFLCVQQFTFAANCYFNKSEDVCLNGGRCSCSARCICSGRRCISEIEAYECICPIGYTGSICQVAVINTTVLAAIAIPVGVLLIISIIISALLHFYRSELPCRKKHEVVSAIVVDKREEEEKEDEDEDEETVYMSQIEATNPLMQSLSQSSSMSQSTNNYLRLPAPQIYRSNFVETTNPTHNYYYNQQADF